MRIKTDCQRLELAFPEGSPAYPSTDLYPPGTSYNDSNNVPPDHTPPAPTYAQYVVGAGIQATFTYWLGYGIAKIGLSPGIKPVDFARLTCVSSFARPAISNQVKPLLGCKGEKTWRDITELFVTSIGTNLVGYGVCAMFGTQLELGTLLRNTVLHTSFAVLSEQLTDIVKSRFPQNVETEQEFTVADEEEFLTLSESQNI